MVICKLSKVVLLNDSMIHDFFLLWTVGRFFNEYLLLYKKYYCIITTGTTMSTSCFTWFSCTLVLMKLATLK